jgi:lysophospholipase L1-like esterase
MHLERDPLISLSNLPGGTTASVVGKGCRDPMLGRCTTVVLHAGTNDLLNNDGSTRLPTKEVLKRLTEGTETLRKKAAPGAIILYSEIFPAKPGEFVPACRLDYRNSVANFVNQRMKQEFRGRVIAYKGLWVSRRKPRNDLISEDGLHLEADGYKYVADVIRDSIKNPIWL